MNILSLFLLAATPMGHSVVPHWDPPMVILGKLAAIAALVALNAFFVACEFSVVKVRTTQLDALGRRQSARPFRQTRSRTPRCLPFGDAIRYNAGEPRA